MSLSILAVPYTVAFLWHQLLVEPTTNCGGCDR
jgi:hypothetical protein